MSTATASNLISVPLGNLLTNPNNPRRKVRPEDVADLVASIESIGLLQPPVVALGSKPGEYVIRAGHRRVEALRVLEAVNVDVIVREEEEDAGLEVALVENGQRVDLDPFAESAGLAEILARPGMTVEAAAKLVGRSTKWVASRSRLSGMTKQARKVLSSDKTFAMWPTSWLAEIAILPTELQDQLFDENLYWANGLRSIEDLRERLGRLISALSLATWDLEDAELHPDGGACKSCPKSSHNVGQAEDLFGDYSEGDASALDGAICLDKACYATKRGLVLLQVVAKAREAHGPAVIFITGGGHRSDAAQDLNEHGIKVMPSWDWERKSKKKGGRAAVYVDGKQAGKLQYVKLHGAGMSSGGRQNRKLTIDERLERVEKRRTKAICEALVETLSGVDAKKAVPSANRLYELFDAWGARTLGDWEMDEGETRADRLLVLNPVDRRAAWPRRRDRCWEVLRGIMDERLAHGQAGREPRHREEARCVAIVIGANWDDLVAKVEADVPLPKSLAKDLEAPKAKKKATKKKGAKKKAAPKGVVRKKAKKRAGKKAAKA